MESFVAASDFHGDRHDPDALAAFGRFLDDFRPKHRLFLGDLWDFRALRTGASREEKLHSMREDFMAGMAFLDFYRPQVFILGNHDQRLWDAVEKDGLAKTGPIPDLASILIEEFDQFADKTKMLVLPYDKRRGVFARSGWKFTHGFDGMAPEKMASVYGNVVYGHGHYITTGTAPRHEDMPPEARMIGSLCRRDMVYNRAQTRTLRQQNGWAYGAFINRTKSEVFQAKRQGNEVVYAETLKTIEV